MRDSYIEKLRTGIIQINLKNLTSIVNLNSSCQELLNIDSATINSKRIKDLIDSRPELSNFLKLIEQIKSSYYSQLYKDQKNFKRLEIYANGRYLNTYLTGLDESNYLLEFVPIIQQDISHTTHELKRPIQNIKALAETLLMGAKDEKELCEEYLKRLSKETDRLSKLVLDILSLSRIKNLKNSLNKSSVSLHKLISEIFNSLETKANEKNLSLKNLCSKDDSLLADKDLLEHMLENLIENAINYNIENGSITVKSSSDFIEITDTGHGIASSDIEKIFDQFYKVNSQNTLGSGLGLSIVKSIVEIHGWNIEVNSTLNKGTSFRISF